jgi:GNAT superfamily N-acetyltransferase
MAEITVRLATLDDVAAITALHTALITRWQRLDAQDRVEDVAYEALTTFERWSHGGAWMSREMGAVHLTHLLRHDAGIPLVALQDGRVIAEAEAFHSVEAGPVGDHLNLAALCVHPDYADSGAAVALLDHLLGVGRDLECRRLVASDSANADFYAARGLQPVPGGQQVTWPARTGQVFYQATPHPHADAAQIRGWAMLLGREHSAHYEWITRWPDLWIGVPELHSQRIERLKFNVAGSNFFVMYAESRYDPRQAGVFLWTGTPLTGPVITAINDHAHKLGFRRLQTVVMPERVASLGPDAEVEGQQPPAYGIDL